MANKSILEGCNAIVDKSLKLSIGKEPCYGKRTSWNYLRELRDLQDPWPGLVKALACQIRKNYLTPTSSEQNWRMDPRPDKSPKNKSPEKLLEKGIVEAPSSWVNQVPTCSGINGSSDSKKRAVDLARLSKDGTLELVELKVASNTPLFAAVEVLLYGLLHDFSKQDLYKKNPPPLLSKPKRVDLIVLAPWKYYELEVPGAQRVLVWIERGIQEGLGTLPGRALPMSFQFQGFTWPNGVVKNGKIQIEPLKKPEVCLSTVETRAPIPREDGSAQLR